MYYQQKLEVLYGQDKYKRKFVNHHLHNIQGSTGIKLHILK